MGNNKKFRKNRIDKRIPYSGHILCSTKSGFFEGELINYSRYGLFIKTHEDLTLGGIITVVLPYMEDEQIKMQGYIRWRNSEGYGVELIRERNDTNFRHFKIVAKSR